MILTLVYLVLILGIIIFVHELGHFITAKKAGCKVEEFGFGFPPRIFSIKRKGTIYSINLIPFGGFVKILGEDGSNKKDPNSFSSKKPYIRCIILAAGVIMNLVLAMVLLSIGFKLGLPTAIDETNEQYARNINVQVLEVAENTPALNSDIQMGDYILQINDIQVTNIEIFREELDKNLGEEVNLTLKRGGEKINTTITPRTEYPDDEGPLGISIVKTGIISYPLLTSIWKGITTTFTLTITIIVAFYEIIKNLLISKPVGMDVTGPIGIAVLTNQATKMGFIYVLQFAAILSINLAIINILPFPALDGGRILFTVIEKIRGKRISQKIENTFHTVGFSLLILLMIFITFRDIHRFRDIFINLWDKIF